MIQLHPHVTLRRPKFDSAENIYRVNMPGDITGDRLRTAIRDLNCRVDGELRELEAEVRTQIAPEQFSFVETSNRVVALSLLDALIPQR